MSIKFIKSSTTAALAVVTLATSFTFVTISDADAGRRDFWTGVGAGFITGVVVNEVARDRRHRHHRVRHQTAWEAHVDWCYNRYRSYSHRDDRYTSHSGYRKRCYSPYN